MGLPASFKSKFHLPEKMQEALARVLITEELPKGYLLFREGDTCHRIFFIEKGLARVYHRSEQEKEITLWFSFENTFLTPIDNFAQPGPTQDNCELLESSIVHSCEFSSLVHLMLEHPDMAMTGFFIAMEFLKQFSDLMANQKFHSAQDRFERLMSNHRETLFQRVQLGHIASYLGITQETLSRLRARKPHPQTGLNSV